jgi:hypothetical protein
VELGKDSNILDISTLMGASSDTHQYEVIELASQPLVHSFHAFLALAYSFRASHALAYSFQASHALAYSFQASFLLRYLANNTVIDSTYAFIEDQTLDQMPLWDFRGELINLAEG